MKYEQIKNELTQAKIKLKIHEQTIRDLHKQNKKLQDVLIKINGIAMRTVNDEINRLE